MLQIADGKLPNPFEVGGSSHADGKDGQIPEIFIRMVGFQDKQEEEMKKEYFKDKLSRLKKVDAKL